MEVTQENFAQELPGILSAIKGAHFLSFDCEFSGLLGPDILPYETPETLYSKYKSAVGEFLIIQFGLCAFRHLPEENRYEYQCYTIYVFPRVPDRFKDLINFTHSIQTSSLEFLSQQQFDFNKTIKNGVGYLRDSELEILKEKVVSIHPLSKTTDSPFKVPRDIKKKMDKILDQVEEYIENEDSSGEEVRPLLLPCSSKFERGLVRKYLNQKYGRHLFMEEKDGPSSGSTNRILLVRKCHTKEEHENLRQQTLQNELEELRQAAGFCQVIKAITESGKLLIGHNMALDLLHTLKAYCTPLPNSWAECKATLHQYFPAVLDTKLLASTNEFGKNLFVRRYGLEDLISQTQGKAFKRFPLEPSHPKFGCKGSKAKLHNAGYDALMTGTVFLKMCAHYTRTKLHHPPNCILQIPWDVLHPYTNKLACFRVRDMPSLSLDREDVIPDRSHVFRVLTSSCLTIHDLERILKPYGQFNISLGGDKEAFIGLQERNRANH